MIFRRVLADENNLNINYFIPKGTNQKRDWLTNILGLPFRNELSIFDQPNQAKEQIKPFTDKIVVATGHSLGGAIVKKITNDYDNISAIVFDPASNNTETDNIGVRLITILPKGGGVLKIPNTIIDSSKKGTEVLFKLNENISNHMFDFSYKEYNDKDKEKIIDSFNENKIIYENNSNKRIENKKKYVELYNKFDKEYINDKRKELFLEILKYPKGYNNFKAKVFIENIDEFLKENVQKDKKTIEREFLEMIEMKIGKFSEHGSGKLDSSFYDIFIKPDEYERIGE